MLPGSRLLSGTVIAGLTFLSCLATPASAGRYSSLRKVLVPKSGDQGKELARGGGKLLVDYGGFELWGVADEPSTATLKAGASSVQDKLHLRGGKFVDTRNASAVAALAAKTDKQGGALRAIQFIGPVRKEWLDELRATQARIVSYMPDNGYVVWCDKSCLSSLEALSAKEYVQWTGDFQPDWKLDPVLASTRAMKTGSVDVTVQLVDAPELKSTLADLMKIATRVIQPASRVLDYTNVSVSVPSSALDELPNWPAVFNVERYVRPEKRDEAQGQIMAGNLTTSGSNVVPTGPGYLDWLLAKGFPTTPSSYPVVDVIDDGIDLGDAVNIRHPDFREFGDDTRASRVAYIGTCTGDALGDGLGGHGNINAGIVGGYNAKAGSAYQDADGYHYGLGISPFGRVAGTRIFNSSGSFNTSNCGGAYAGIYQKAWSSGARITSNSWGAAMGGAYTAASQAYDVGTRDASPTESGNQEILHVISAGNSGPSSTTIGAPGTAKNVLTVGATENVRAEGTYDGCSISASNNADDVIDFSSRGPTSDGRMKPDITAPGVHITGPASQHPSFTGRGVCGMSSGAYYPIGQTLYTWSSGTSHSCPAAAGAAQLAYQYYGRAIKPGAVPSPAMLKALIVNSARFISGYNAGTTLPTTTQGWGDVNLGRLFDDGFRQTIDQSVVFQQSGETYDLAGSVADPTKPLRITLVWTDAPGNTTGAAYVNDLDLEVTVGTTIYRGNVFSGQYSTTGGSSDARNNVENVFLPAGTTGPISVRVLARNIAGDGIPGNADLTDQDFALLAYNVSVEPRAILSPDSVLVTKIVGNPLVGIEPGDSLRIRTGIRNVGDLALPAASGLLRSSSRVALGDSTKAFPALDPASRSWGSGDYSVKVQNDHPCGAGIVLRERLVAGSDTVWRDIVLPGRATGGSDSSKSVPVSIRDNDSAIALIASERSGAIKSLKVRVGITHTYTGDLRLELVSPNGIRRVLADRLGGSGDNFTQTVFDDAATTPISSGSAPFIGSFRPKDSLGVFKGASAKGTWKLVVTDLASGDVGSVNFFAMDIQTQDSGCSTNKAPIVKIRTPVAGSIHEMFDTLVFRADYSDDGKVSPVTLLWTIGSPDSHYPMDTVAFAFAQAGWQTARVEAFDGQLVGVDSVRFRIAERLMPPMVQVMPDSGAVHLNWVAVAPEDSVVFVVERAVAGESFFAEVGRSNGNSFLDTTATPSKFWQYRVNATRKGRVVVGQISEAVSPYPTRIVDLRMVPARHTISLSWRVERNAYAGWEFQVQRTEDPTLPYTTIATTMFSSYIDSSLRLETKYYYRILGTTSTGGAAISSIDSAALVIPTLPAPANVRGVARSHAIELSWDSVVSTEGPVTYEIQLADDQGAFQPLTTTVARNFSKIGLPNGVATKWRIVAMNLEARSAPSAVVTLTPRPDTLLAPANVRGVARSHAIELSWDSVVSTEGPVTYEIQLADDQGVFQPLTTTVARNFSKIGLPNGVATQWRIVAMNLEARSAPSAVVTLTPRPDTLLAPANVRGIARSHAIELSWDSVVSTEGPVTYEIQLADDQGVFQPLTTTVARNFSKIGLPNGVATQWRIVAMNLEARSAPSTVVTLTPRPDTLLAPVVVSRVGDRSAWLQWNRVSSTEGPVTYELRRRLASESNFVQVWSGVDSLLQDTGLVNGASYVYQVRARNLETTSAWSAEIRLVPFAAPEPIDSLKATFDGSAVNLTIWTVFEPGDSIEVFRAVDESGNYVRLGAVASTSYRDAGVVPGTTYNYFVRHLRRGQNSAASAIATIRVPLVPPQAPTGLRAVAGDRRIQLSWNRVAGTIGYTLRRAASVAGPFSVIAAPADTFWTDTGLVNDVAYFYTVASRNRDSQSVASAAVSATPVSPLPPAPTGLVAAAGNRQVQLSWSPVAGAVRYIVKSSTSAGGPYNRVDSTTTTGIVVGNLVNGTSYRFVVSAVNAFGEGANSTEAAAVPVAPSNLKVLYKVGDASATDNTIRPLLQIANSGSTPVDLSTLKIRYWYTNEQNKGQAFWCDWAQIGSGNVAGAWTALNPVVPGSDGYMETSFKSAAGSIAANGNSGEIQVRISRSDWSNHNETGDWSYDATKTSFAAWDRITLYQNGVLVWGTEPRVATPPAKVVGLAGVAGNRQASLSWTATASATSYNVYRRTTSGTQQLAKTVTTTSWTDTGLVNLTPYTYWVSALSGTLEGAKSDSVVVVPRGVAPAKVTGLAGVASNHMVALSWSASAGATSYKVRRGIGSASTTVLATVSGTSFRDTTAGNDTAWVYSVVASNEWGDAPASDSVIAVPRAPQAPAKVVGLAGVAGNRQASLSWTATASTTSYNVYRLTAGGVQQLAKTVTTTNWTDTGLVNLTSYTYWVSALNGTLEGAKSDSVVVVPKAPVGGLKAQYKVGNTAATSNAIRPLLQIVNTGSTAIPLSEVTVRYWFTNDGTAGLSYWCDWAQVGTSNLTGVFGTVSPARTGADRYLELSFKTSAGSLAAGASTGEIQSRFSKTDWSNFTQTGDASFDATQSNYADWSKVTVYRNGTLVWGTEP